MATERGRVSREQQQQAGGLLHWDHKVDNQQHRHIITSTKPIPTQIPFLPCCHSSDVVWEFKPKKKNRWKTLSTHEAEMLEDKFRDYTESGSVDNGIFDLENNMQVRDSRVF